MIARFFYRLFLRLFAKRIVKDAYLGVLSRPADEAGRRAYSWELTRRRDLAWLLSDLLASGEARSRFQLTAPNEIVISAFEAVLRRTPTKEELDTRTKRLSEGETIAALLRDLSAGHAGFTISDEEAEELVRAAFRGLLQRDPEPTALAGYTRVLLDTGDLTQFLAEIGNSEEHKELIHQKHRRTRAFALR
jgi:hypothetical protein